MEVIKSSIYIFKEKFKILFLTAQLSLFFLQFLTAFLSFFSSSFFSYFGIWFFGMTKFSSTVKITCLPPCENGNDLLYDGQFGHMNKVWSKPTTFPSFKAFLTLPFVTLFNGGEGLAHRWVKIKF